MITFFLSKSEHRPLFSDRYIYIIYILQDYSSVKITFMVLREIHVKIDIMPNWLSYSLQPKNFLIFWIIHESTTFRKAKCYKRLKKQQTIKFDVFNLRSNVSDSKCHKKKWCMLFFLCIKLVVCVLACGHAIAHIKCRRLRP